MKIQKNMLFLVQLECKNYETSFCLPLKKCFGTSIERTSDSSLHVSSKWSLNALLFTYNTTKVCCFTSCLDQFPSIIVLLTFILNQKPWKMECGKFWNVLAITGITHCFVKHLTKIHKNYCPLEIPRNIKKNIKVFIWIWKDLSWFSEKQSSVIRSKMNPFRKKADGDNRNGTVLAMGVRPQIFVQKLEKATGIIILHRIKKNVWN